MEEEKQSIVPQNVVERPLMGEQEFKEYLGAQEEESMTEFKDKGILTLINYAGVSKFKSVRRAIKRGLMSPLGTMYPKRPFNNRGNTCTRDGHYSRETNEIKKDIYGQYKHARSRIAQGL